MIFIRRLIYRCPNSCFKSHSVISLPKLSLIGKLFTVSFSVVKQVKPTMGDTCEGVKCVNGIIKSPEDKRCYRGLELSNKLKILLISDPDTDKASASMHVNVGFFSDPDEIPGLAHFCEHMLFLGTNKYPVENDYSKYVSEHGGICNANTSSDFTNYYFDVLPEHLKGALDRFAQFFIAPLFTESATEREINAVNSEYEKNVPLDPWRFIQLERHISKEGHVFRKFGVGNLETLSKIPKEKGIDIRQELLKFHQKWYSANIMSLVILGKESLDDLEKMAVSLFSEVQNKDVVTSEWTEHPLGPEHLQIKSFVVPVKDLKVMNISFPTPDFQKHYKTSPFNYLSHLIGHEGPGSLLSALKARGWCNRLESGNHHGGKGFGFFIIKVDLTEDGMEHVDDIVTLVFQYIHMLKEEGPKLWIFEEIQQLFQRNFRFKEKEVPVVYASRLARRMIDYELEEVLSGPYFLTEWKPELIELALTYLQPKFVRISVAAQKYESIANETEPWFKAKYKIEKIPTSKIEKWENCGLCNELKLPEPNLFIPNNFEILPREEKMSGQHPVIILDSSLSRVWFKQDDEFLLPKANLKFEFNNPWAYYDPLNCAMTCLYLQVLTDSLKEFAYDAELAGLSWILWNTEYGMTLNISGYNDKLGVLLDKILERMVTLKIDPKRFELLKELYLRTLKNFAMEQPYHQAIYYLTLITSEHAWSKAEVLKSAEDLTLERLEEFIPQLLSRVYIECLIHGNVNREGAFKIIDIVEKRLKTKGSLLPILPRQMFRVREIQLVDDTFFMYETPNDFFKSSCTENYYQCGLMSTENNMVMQLLQQIIHDPCFDILRTKEQLGYIVLSGLRHTNSVQGLRIIVQSDRHPSVIDQRIEAFLVQFRDILVEMSAEEFERHRESLATVLLEKPKTMSALSRRWWDEISSQQYHFNRAEVEVAYLKKITKEQMIEFYDEFIKSGAPHRRKLSVYIVAKGQGGAGNLPEPDMETLSTSINGLTPPPPYVQPVKIEDITKFKSSHGLYPLVQPYININSLITKSKL